MLNVQAFLEERYPQFVSKHRRASATLVWFLRYLFHESRFQQFEKDYPHLEGFDFIDQTLRYFDFTLRLRDKERARIPDTGRVIIAANHPIGSLDGLALLNLVRQVRPDVKVVANDMLATLKRVSLRKQISALGLSGRGSRKTQEILENLVNLAA